MTRAVIGLGALLTVVAAPSAFGVPFVNTVGGIDNALAIDSIATGDFVQAFNGQTAISVGPTALAGGLNVQATFSYPNIMEMGGMKGFNETNAQFALGGVDISCPAGGPDCGGFLVNVRSTLAALAGPWVDSLSSIPVFMSISGRSDISLLISGSIISIGSLGLFDTQPLTGIVPPSIMFDQSLMNASLALPPTGPITVEAQVLISGDLNAGQQVVLPNSLSGSIGATSGSSTPTVPEPGSWLLLLTGLGVFAAVRRNR